MAIGETKKITGSLTLEDRYQTTIYDDILTISGAEIVLNDPAGEIFTDKGNDTVTVTNSTISNKSETGAELMFSMGSGDDTLDISNTTLEVNTFMGSGNDKVTVSGGYSSIVTISNQFSLGAGDDTLTLKSSLTGLGDLVFGDGSDTLVFDGGHLQTETITGGLEHLAVTGNSGTMLNGLTLSGEETSMTLNGNLSAEGSTRTLFITSGDFERGTHTLTTDNNVFINKIGLSIRNVTLTHADGGTLEIKNVSGIPINVYNSTVSLHNLVIAECTNGIKGENSTIELLDTDISGNYNRAILAESNTNLSLTKTNITNNNDWTSHEGAFIFSTSGGSHATASANATAIGGGIQQSDGNITLSDVGINRNFALASAATYSSYIRPYYVTASASATAVGGAVSQLNGNITGSMASFIENHVSADAIASSPTAESTNRTYANALALGGAIAKTNGDLNLASASFSGNYVTAKADGRTTATADASGGAIAQTSGDLILNDASFSGNYIQASASALYGISSFVSGGAIAHESGKVVLSDVSFSGNHASAGVTQLYVAGSGSAMALGGGIAQKGGDVEITDASFSGNYIYATAGGYRSSDVLAYASGGAIAQDSGNMTLSNVLFAENYASANIGTPYNDSYAAAFAYGGAIAHTNGNITLTDVTFSGNCATASASKYSYYAAEMGGAIYLNNSIMNYHVSKDKDLENTGNRANEGGFLYLAGNSVATFNVEGSLTIGDSSGNDSIAGHSSSTIIKTGDGTWTIHSDEYGYFGYWYINDGILKLDRIARYITLDNWTIGVDAELHLSALDDTITMYVDKKIGTIDLGGGSDTIDTGGYHLSEGLLRISTLTLTGGGKVSSEITNRTAGTGFDLILDDVTLNSIITGGNAADKITITQTSTIGGPLNLGGGANVIFADEDTETIFAKAVTLGSGKDTLTFGDADFRSSLELGNGANTFTAAGSATVDGSFSAGSGNDTLSFGSVNFGSSVNLGDGDNTLTSEESAKFSGAFTAGSGNDTLTFGSATFQKDVALGDGNNKITATTAIFNGNLTAGSGNDTFNLKQDSELRGDIALGGGKNYIYVTKNLTITDGFTLDPNGETHLIVYNGASLASNSLNIYAPDSTETVTATYDWSDVEGLDKVRILVSSDPTFENYEFAVELYNQTKDFTLNVSPEYYIQFQAQDEDGWSHRILPDTEAPDQVSGFKMDGTTAVWTATHDNLGGNGVKQYKIQVARDANFSSIIGTYTSTENSYDFSSYADGKYFIRIQAEDYTGNVGEWSEVENLLIDSESPSEPIVTCSVSNKTISVDWEASEDYGSGVKEYRIEISPSWEFSDITASATVTGTSFTAENLADGEYYIRVQAIDHSGNASVWSSNSSVIVDTTAPSKVTGLRAIENSGIISLNWDFAEDAGIGVKEYIVQYSKNSNFSSVAGTQTVTSDTCDFSNLADGKYYFRVKAVDKNGNVGEWSNSASAVVDSTAPSIPGGLNAVTGNYSVSLSWNPASDILSGVKEYEYVILNNGIIVHEDITSSLNVSVSDIGYGNYSWKVRAIDEKGNAGEWSTIETFSIADTTKPELTLSGNSESWTNQPVTITAEATDSESGIKSIEYSTDNRTWKTGSSVTLTENGTVYFRVTDNDGNITTQSTVVDKIDTDNPSFSITGTSDVLTNKDVVLNISASDSTSGIKSIQYSFDRKSWQNGSSATVDSNKTVYFKVTDNAGNVTEKSVDVTNIDKVAPTKPKAAANILEPTNGDVIVTATFSADTVRREYSLDNQTWKTYTSGILMEENGNVYFRAKDEAGNISDVTIFEVTNIDKVAPSKPVVSADIVDPTNGYVTVTASFSSDSYKKEYSLDNRTWKTYTTGVVMEDNGMVYFRAKDEAGNVSTVASYEVSNIDRIAPTKPRVSADIVDLTNTDVTVTASFSSDSYKKEYSFDNRTWKTYTSGVVMEDNGMVYFRAKDEAGNISPVASYEVTNIDKVAPTKPRVSADIVDPTKENVTVTASFSSDSYKKEYSLDNRTWRTYTSGIVMEENGTVYFRAKDEAGNISVTTYEVTNIDRIAPVKPTVSADIVDPTSGSVTVTASFSSDSYKKEYSLDNKTWQTYTSGIVMEENGTVYFRAKDEAGNISSVASYEVTNIDKVAPTKPRVSADVTDLTNQPVTVTASFSSDTAEKQYSLNNQLWLTYTSGVVMPNNGTVYFRGLDAAGNISDVVSYEVTNIDDAVWVTSGVVSSGVTVNRLNCMKVFSGGVASDTIINFGTVHVSGGTIRDTTNSGGTIEIYDGVAEYTKHTYGNINVAGGMLNSTTFNGGKITVTSGGTVNNTEISNGGVHISSGGTANYTSADNLQMYIYSGGTANHTVANNHITKIFISGGTANSTTFAAKMYILSGGVANNTVNSRGYLYVSSGGTAYDTTITELGRVYVLEGGSANNTNVTSGYMYISSGGIHTGELQISSGRVYAYEGSVIDFTLTGRSPQEGYLLNKYSRISENPTFTITVSQDQEAGVYGLAQDASKFNHTVTLKVENQEIGTFTVGQEISNDNHHYQLILSGGNLNLSVNEFTNDPVQVCSTGDLVKHGSKISGEIITSGESMFISAGGSANYTSVFEGGTVNVSNGGSMFGVNLYSGADLNISSGGTVNTMFYNGPATATIHSGGQLTSTTVNSSGTLNVYDGAKVTSATLKNGGTMNYHGGTVYNVDLLYGGVMNIQSGAVRKGQIADKGQMFVSNGGVASGAIIKNGGIQHVLSGGSADDTQIWLNGIVQVSSGAVVTDMLTKHGAKVHVFGGTISNTTMERGITSVYQGGKAVETEVGYGAYLMLGFTSDGCSGVASSYDTTVLSGGGLTVMSGAVAEDTVNYGTLTCNNGGTLLGETVIHGRANLAGEAIVTDKTSITFDVSNRSASAMKESYREAMLNSYYVAREADMTISVSADQAEGSYILANWALEAKKGTFTLEVDGTEVGTFSTTKSLTYDGKTYSLYCFDDATNSKALTLKVCDAADAWTEASLTEETSDIIADYDSMPDLSAGLESDEMLCTTAGTDLGDLLEMSSEETALTAAVDTETLWNISNTAGLPLLAV